jgi:hypothetical protein
MGLAEDIARVRQRARGAEINARHRRARERSQQMAAAMAPSTPADGVNPDFAKQLEAARQRAKSALEASEAQPKNPSDRIQQLVMEGKLPPRPGDGGVGYEPTAEEVLGELGEPTAPDGTEELPDAAAVLSGDAETGAGGWGQAPAPAAAAAAPGAALAPAVAPPLARPDQPVQSKRKRGK